MQAGVTKDCFAGVLVLGGGIALGKLLAGLLIGAGVVAGGIVIGAAVSIAVNAGLFTYQTHSLTRAKAESREKTAKRKKGNDPEVYYLAELFEDKVCILSSPWRKKTAVNKINNYGNSFWTPLKPHAKALAECFSRDVGDPEIHKDLKTGVLDGRYYHYHPIAHYYQGKSVHIWFGYPEGGKY